MTRSPLFIAPDAIQPPRITLTGAEAHRVERTLRLRPGSRVRVSDGVATIVEAELDRFHRGKVEGEIVGSTPLPPEPVPAVEIVQVLPKPALADRIIGPCTTLGVAAFRFARGDHTPVGPLSNGWGGRVARWQTIARQAAEQSGRGRVPPCVVYPSLAQCLAEAPADLRLAGDPAIGEQSPCTLREGVGAGRGAARVQWLIGPEGGFSADERARFDAWGVRAVSLGSHILRLETAAVVAAALIMYELELM